MRNDLELYELNESQEVITPILSEGGNLQPLPIVAEDSGINLP